MAADSWGPETTFEGRSHQALHDMIAGSDPAAVLGVGTALADAGTHIQLLADDLAQHIIGLQWTGSAAESFTAWARRFISATDTLATYAGNTSTAVAMAGEQLSSSKAGMPPVPYADMATVEAFKRQQYLPTGSVGVTMDGTIPDPASAGSVTVPPGGITQQQAFNAQTNVQRQYQEALVQMERLGGAYVGAVATMSASTVPIFPPLPSELMPPETGYAKLVDVPVPGRSPSGSGSSSDSRSSTKGSGAMQKDNSPGGHQPGSGAASLVPIQSMGTGGSRTSKAAGTAIQGRDPSSGLIGGSGGVGSSGVTGGSPGGGTISGGAIPKRLQVFGSSAPAGDVARAGGSGPEIEGGAGGRSTGSGGVENSGVGGGAAGGRDSTLPDPDLSAIHRDPGISGGAVSPNAGKRTYGASAVGDDVAETGGSSFAVGSGLTGSSAGGSDGNRFGSSTAQSGLGEDVVTPADSAASTSGSLGATPMMPTAGMGAMSSAGGRRKKGRRSGYLMEDAETWASGTPEANPAVIE